jgi:predicted TIM-barrel fold metal-dependent hydrolase
VDPRCAAGSGPATTVEALARDVLDPLGVEKAVLSCYWAVESIRHPDFAQGLCRALNDWLVAEWLEQDPRLTGSIVVPGFVPEEAAAEVERIGGHPQVVQVLLPVRSSRLFGHRTWHPLLAAIERNGLVAGLHHGGVPEVPGPAGATSWFLEDYVAGVQVFQAQLVSLVAEGAFERFPGLRVTLMEGGFTWLGPTLWRMDHEWKGLRRDIPWVKRKPSATVREHVKLTVKPIGAGPPADFGTALGWLGSDDLLMFATDYPHGHEDAVDVLLDALGGDARDKLMAGNARAHYGL